MTLFSPSAERAPSRTAPFLPAALAAALVVATPLAGIAQTGEDESLVPPTAETLEPDPLGDPLAERGGLEEPADPMEGSGQAARQAIEAESAIEAGMVEVSLGDWALKNELAEALDVPVSSVPLTVNVSGTVAGEVCPIGSSTLDQQGALAAQRTCAAKTMTDDLVTAVEEQGVRTAAE